MTTICCHDSRCAPRHVVVAPQRLGPSRDSSFCANHHGRRTRICRRMAFLPNFEVVCFPYFRICSKLIFNHGLSSNNILKRVFLKFQYFKQIICKPLNCDNFFIGFYLILIIMTVCECCSDNIRADIVVWVFGFCY